MDDELLGDFLVEAGELIEQLDEQLIGLEQAPDDAGLLNSVFRAFHTVKGGAGFLGLAPLVELCHRAEDVLNMLRSAQLRLEASVMDQVLASVDELKRMFAELQDGQAPSGAAPALLAALDALRKGDGAAKAPEEPRRAVEPVRTKPEPAGSAPPPTDPLLASFDAMVQQAAGAATAVAAGGDASAAASSGDTISEDEFEALLDEIQGRAPAAAPPPLAPAPPVRPSLPSAAPAAAREPRSAPVAAAEPSLRVDAARIDGLMNLVGELVLVRNRLSALRARVADEEVHKSLSQLSLVTSDMQASVMRLRMQPVSKVFGRFTRVVRDLARQLGKEVELETSGENTELDKSMVESLADPLVHLVRNAVDHGIEAPAARAAAGKDPAGRVTLSALQEGSHILISVADDGAGLDGARIRDKAVEKGLVDSLSAAQMSDEEALQLIFLPGFSTKTEVTDVSGRGVGMDVVKSQITRVNGAVELRSQRGKGSEVVIKLPLTLAIMPTLMAVVRGQRFALPLAAVREIVELDNAHHAIMDGQDVVSLRGQVLPLLDLANWVGQSEGRESGRSVVVASGAGQEVGLVVDSLIGQEEVVIKPLGPRLETLAGLAGATITGDGQIALIVDIGGLHQSWPRILTDPRRTPAVTPRPVES